MKEERNTGLLLVEGRWKIEPPCCSFSLQRGRRLCDVTERSGIIEVSVMEWNALLKDTASVISNIFMKNINRQGGFYLTKVHAM